MLLQVEVSDLRNIVTVISGTSLVLCLFLFTSISMYYKQQTSSEWLTILWGCWGLCSSSSSSRSLVVWGDWGKTCKIITCLFLSDSGLVFVFGLYNTQKDPLLREREKARWGTDTMCTVPRVRNCRYFFLLWQKKLKPFLYCFIVIILFYLIA